MIWITKTWQALEKVFERCQNLAQKVMLLSCKTSPTVVIQVTISFQQSQLQFHSTDNGAQETHSSASSSQYNQNTSQMTMMQKQMEQQQMQNQQLQQQMQQMQQEQMQQEQMQQQ